MKSNRRQGIVLAVLLIVLSCAAACSRGRTDAQISTDVQSKIYADPNVPSRPITVQSNNGVVTLSGTVGTEAERSVAGNDAGQIEGARSVVNNLEVKPAAASEPGELQTAPQPAAPPLGERPHKLSAHRAAIKPAPQEPRTAAAVVIPEGTRLSVRMIDSVDSDKNKVGDTFRATLDAPIVVDDRVIVPKDADIEGRVVELKSAGHMTGRSELGLELVKLMVNGKAYALQTGEYTRQGGSRGKRTAETVGGGAALGAIVGAVAGGGKGAAIGAAAGAGAGTAVQVLTKGQQIHVPSETVLEFQLKTPLKVGMSSRSTEGQAR